MSLFTDVGEFHKRFKLPVSCSQALATGAGPNVPAEDVFLYRYRFLQEEMRELEVAFHKTDLAGIADALADLVWVALGTAHYCGLPFDEVWAEVRRANMEKRPWAKGDPVKKRARGLADMSLEVVKPENWEPPRIQPIIEKWGG